MHDLDHVQVDGAAGRRDGQDGVRDDLGELVGELQEGGERERGGSGRTDLLVELGAERGAGDAREQLAVLQDLRLVHLEAVEDAERLFARELKALGEDARVQPVREEALGLLEQLDQPMGLPDCSRYGGDPDTKIRRQQ